MNMKKLLVTLILIVVACGGTISSITSVSIIPSAFAATRLGDISKFKKIIVDIESLVDKGDLASAKIRIKDLETTWDEAEAGIKPRAASDWHLLDKGIDRALNALRADPPSQTECKKTLAELRGQFETMELK